MSTGFFVMIIIILSVLVLYLGWRGIILTGRIQKLARALRNISSSSDILDLPDELPFGAHLEYGAGIAPDVYASVRSQLHILI